MAILNGYIPIVYLVVRIGILVGGWPTPLKNMQVTDDYSHIWNGKEKCLTGWWCNSHFKKTYGVRQWEGWHPIYEMENNTCLKPPTRCKILGMPSVHRHYAYSDRHLNGPLTYRTWKTGNSLVSIYGASVAIYAVLVATPFSSKSSREPLNHPSFPSISNAFTYILLWTSF